MAFRRAFVISSMFMFSNGMMFGWVGCLLSSQVSRLDAHVAEDLIHYFLDACGLGPR